MSFSVHPLPLPFSVRCSVHPYPNAVLSSILPRANVFVAIWPLKSAFSVFLPIFKVSFVPSAVIPLLHSLTFHVAHSKFPHVELLEVSKEVLAVSLELAVNEVALVVAAVFPLELPFPILLSLEELSRVGGCSIVPRLAPLPVLHVIQPLSLVHRALRIDEHPVPICLVVFPLSFVDISIRMSHSSPTIGFVFAPAALVLGAVWPELDSNAVPLLVLFIPLPLIQAAIAHILEFINVHSLDVVLCLQILLVQLERLQFVYLRFHNLVGAKPLGAFLSGG